MKDKVYGAVWDFLDGDVHLYLFSSFEKALDDLKEISFIEGGIYELTDPNTHEYTIYRRDMINKFAKVTIGTYTLDNVHDYFTLKENW